MLSISTRHFVSSRPTCNCRMVGFSTSHVAREECRGAPRPDWPATSASPVIRRNEINGTRASVSRSRLSTGNRIPGAHSANIHNVLSCPSVDAAIVHVCRLGGLTCLRMPSYYVQAAHANTRNWQLPPCDCAPCTSRSTDRGIGAECGQLCHKSDGERSVAFS